MNNETNMMVAYFEREQERIHAAEAEAKPKEVRTALSLRQEHSVIFVYIMESFNQWVEVW